jgi:hypothetical protein
MPDLLPAFADCNQSFLCHFNNIAQKRRTASNTEQRALLEKINSRYCEYLGNVQFADIARGDVSRSVDALEKYLFEAKAVERLDKRFNWRSDFCGSVIPEFLYCAFNAVFRARGIQALFATRDSVVEISLAGSQDGGWDVRHKNQDLSIGLREASIVQAGITTTFVVPVIAMEVKTNIDINKLNGLDFSAERLKRTFPSARYVLVTETIDFSLKDNYASGSIDEIYVLRKQVRSQARRNRAHLQPEVFKSLFEDVATLLTTESVVRGHVYSRLTSGKLIRGEA